MTSSHGRRIQGRRALAIMAWATLVVVAWLLWYGQHNRIIRIQAWEPAALLLSAYAAFLAIFGWLLFSPGRKSAEESPALFFSGMLTLIPPCFIAYYLMPVDSPLKPWVTIGVFVFGIIAIMSPIPDEVFAVPRDRRSYLQPLTSAYLSDLDVDALPLSFEDLAPKTAFWLSRPTPEVMTAGTGVARDPWEDPFYGTGRQMSRIGVSKSRRTEEPSTSERRKLTERAVGDEVIQGLPVAMGTVQPSFSNLVPPRSPGRPVSEPVRQESDLSPRTDISPSTARIEKSAAAPPRVQESSFRPQSISPTTPPPVPLPGSSRRPLTEPGSRSNTAVGFQTPGSHVRAESAPSLPLSLPPVVLPLVSLPPLIPQPVSVPTPVVPVESRPLESRPLTFGTHSVPGSQTLSKAQLAAGVSSLPAAALKVPLAPQLATSLPMPDLFGTTARLNTPPLYDPEAAPSQSSLKKTPEPVMAPLSSSSSVGRPAELSVQELDRKLRSEEAAAAKLEEELEVTAREIAASREIKTIAAPVSEVVQQTSNDISLERIRDEHGGEMIEGTIKVFFEVGQKRAHLHVPFSPPLAGLPEVECEPAGDDQVRLKVAVRQPYGVRIEARRAEAAHALRTEISFAAVYTPTSPRG